MFPVQSPLMCAAIYARQELGVTGKLAFISPCIAKKLEIDDPNTHGLVNYNVTFDHLIDYVEQHKLELGELYESYKPRMDHFLVDQIQKERINRHLAYLYQKILTPAMVDQQNANALSKLLFAHRISVEDSRLIRVILYQKGLCTEQVYPLQNGTTWVPVYGNDTVILFEDAYGNRFAKSVEYTLEKLMIPGKFLKLISSLVQDNLNLDVYLTESARDRDDITSEVADRMLRIASDAQVEPALRRSLYLELLHHFYDVDNMKALGFLL